MRTIANSSREAWVRGFLDDVDNCSIAKHRAPAQALDVVPWRRGEAFGWLKQQSLLRRRQDRRADGTFVKQRLFSFDDIPPVIAQAHVSRPEKEKRAISDGICTASGRSALARLLRVRHNIAYADADSRKQTPPEANAESRVPADLAAASQPAACMRHAVDAAGNAALSPYLSDLEARVNALQQSAEGLGCDCLPILADTPARPPDFSIAAYRDAAPASAGACDWQSSAVQRGAQPGQHNAPPPAHADNLASRQAAVKTPEPALPTVAWWQEPGQAEELVKQVQGLQVDWREYCRCAGGRDMVAAITECTAQLEQLEHQLSARRAGHAVQQASTFPERLHDRGAATTAAQSPSNIMQGVSTSGLTASRAHAQPIPSSDMGVRRAGRRAAWRKFESRTACGTRPAQPQQAANSAPCLERQASPVQFRAKPMPSFIKKRAEEYRKRKAEQAQHQQGQPAPDLPSHQQGRAPHTGAPRQATCWPGERVIGGGPWSQLPRWRTDNDISRPQVAPSKAHVQPMPPLSAHKMPRLRTPLQYEAKAQAAGRDTELTGFSAQSMRLGGATERPRSAPDVMLADSGPGWHVGKQHQPGCDTERTAGASAYVDKQEQKSVPGQQSRRADRQHVGKQHVKKDDREQGTGTERVVYVQRPAAQKPLRRAGSVPNFKELHAAWSERLAAAKASMHKRLTKSQAFHLSQRKSRATYIWADTEDQHCHDSFSSKHADAAAPGHQAAHPYSSKRKAGPFQPTPGNTKKAAAEQSSPQHAPGTMRKQGMSDESPAADHVSCQGLAPLREVSKEAAVGAVADALSDADIREMLAVHARTQERAQSLIDKVHLLKTDCRALLTEMPADILSEA